MTQQTPDTLIYQNEKWALLREPLDAYLAINGIELSWASSDVMRGYRATWEIVDDELLLEDVQECYCVSDPQRYDETTKLNIQDIFPNDNPPILVNWFSGKLVVGRGKCNGSTIAGYAEPYDHMLNIHLERGIVVSVESCGATGRSSDAGEPRSCIPFVAAGAILGAIMGSSFGIAGMGGAIAGTVPVGILGGYIGYRVCSSRR